MINTKKEIKLKLVKEVLDAFNMQLQQELSNSIQYLSMAAFFSEMELSNIVKHFMLQSKEEKKHSDKILKFMFDINIPYLPTDMTIAQNTFENPLKVLSTYYKLEDQTTKKIEALSDVCLTNKAILAYEFALSLLSEQREELATARKFYINIKNAVNEYDALLLLDHSLHD